MEKDGGENEKVCRLCDLSRFVNDYSGKCPLGCDWLFYHPAAPRVDH